MSDREAQQEAVRRWGESGVAWHGVWVPGYPARRHVGAKITDTRDGWQIFGSGRSWEAAFADAARRGH